MLEHIDNHSACLVHPFMSSDRNGYEVFVVIAKLTYSVTPRGEVRLPREPAPVRITPEINGNGQWASHRFPSDCVDEKPGTDVVLVGTAQPSAARARHVDVALRVGSGAIGKRARVHGARVWKRTLRGVRPSEANWLEPTPLVYEETYGGRDESDPNDPIVDLRNPAGRGVARDRRTLVDQPTPSIEDPSAPLDSDDPAPAGFAPLPSSWEPRRSFAGTHDEHWRRSRAPVPPKDFDPRYYSVASPGLWSAAPLQGDEPIAVTGVRPEGAWHFHLPRFRPLFAYEGRTLESHLDTYLIDADRGRVELVWRAALRLPRAKLGTVVVESEGDGNFQAVFGYSVIEMAKDHV